jgi:hypothetical protein
MLIQYTESFNNNSIRKIAKLYKIKYVSKIKKKILIELLNEFNAAKIIQRWLRKKLMVHTECPISLKKLEYPFISFKINGKFFYYDFESILNYFIKSGNFIDPCTRQPILDNKISQINSMVKYYYGKNTTNVLITSNMIKNAELHIISYCLYDIIRQLELFPGEIEIKNILLPRFIYYINSKS